MSTLHNFTTHKDLVREVGHADGGKKLSGYLRKTYPHHFKHERWELTPVIVADARAHF